MSDVDKVKALFSKPEIPKPAIHPLEKKQEEIKLEEVKRPAPIETAKGKILREHNYIESDIPLNHPYWRMR